MRKVTLLLLVLSMVFLGASSCLLDPVEAPPSSSTAVATVTTEAPTTTTAPLSTTTPATAAPETTTTAPPETTTTTTIPMTTSLPAEEVLNYLKQTLTAEVGISQLVEEIIGISNDWDNRSETDVTFPDTEAAMEEAVANMEKAKADFDLIQAPPTDGYPEKHLIATSTVGQIAVAAGEMLAGLQSADTGQQRQTAQVGLAAAFGVFKEAIDAIIAEYIGDEEITALIVSRDLTVSAPAGSDATTTTTEPSG